MQGTLTAYLNLMCSLSFGDPQLLSIKLLFLIPIQSMSPMEISYPPWEDLPAPALELVLERLPVPDYLRFPAVCPNWRDVQRDHRCRLGRHAAFSSPSSQMPWLMKIISDDDGKWVTYGHVGQWVSFERQPIQAIAYNLSEQRCYRLPLTPKTEDQYCYSGSSSHGWLILVERIMFGMRTITDMNMLLVNPFATPGSEIEIPIPQNILIPYRCSWAIISSPPTDPDCVVLYRGFSRYSYCRVRDKQWIISPQPIQGDDEPSVAVCGGKFYIAIMPSGYVSDGRELLVVEPFPILTRSFLHMDTTSFPVSTGTVSSYLVESNGQILLAKLYTEIVQEGAHYSEFIDKRTVLKGIRVFRADLSRKVWVRLESLGDRVLFLDNFNSCFSISAAKTGGPGNLIYLAKGYPYDHVLWFEYDYGSHRLINSNIPRPGKHIREKFKNTFLRWMVPSIL